MDIIFYILRQKFSFVGKILKGKEFAPKIVFFAFIALFLLIMAGEFFGFLRAFKTLGEQEFFGPPLTLFVLEEFFFFAFVLFVLSSIIAGFFIFYKSSDFSFLLSLPLSSSKIFFLKFTEIALLSSWPLLLLSGPLLLAYGITEHAGPAFYILAAISLVFFAVFSLSLSSISVFAAASVFGRLPKFINLLIAIMGLLAAGYLISATLVPKTDVLTKIFEADNLGSVAASTRFIEEKFSRWPSHYLSMVIFMGPAATANAYSMLLTQFLSGFTALVFNIFIAGFFYQKLVLSWQEGRFRTNANGNFSRKKRSNKSRVFPRYLRGKIGAVLEKDFISFARNYQEVSRALFILFLLFIYVAAITVAGRRIGNFAPNAERLVLSLHLIAISYFATILSLRFVFPLISLEGRSAWIIWSAPIDRKKIFLEKFFLAGAALYLIVGIFMIVTSLALGLSVASIAVSAALLLFLILTIVGLSLSFGTMFPNFHETNIDRLTTSTGGLLTTFVSLAYGLLMGLLNFKIISFETQAEFWPWFLLALGISILLIASSLYSGIKRIRHIEVV